MTDRIFLKNTAGGESVGNVKYVSISNSGGVVAFRYSSFSSAGISVRDLPNGIHFVQIIKTGGLVSTHKIMVSR